MIKYLDGEKIIQNVFFCKYYSARRVGIEEVMVQQCIAKDKFLNDFTERIPRYFCETYEVKE